MTTAAPIAPPVGVSEAYDRTMHEYHALVAAQAGGGRLDGAKVQTVCGLLGFSYERFEADVARCRERQQSLQLVLHELAAWEPAGQRGVERTREESQALVEWIRSEFGATERVTYLPGMGYAPAAIGGPVPPQGTPVFAFKSRGQARRRLEELENESHPPAGGRAFSWLRWIAGRGTLDSLLSAASADGPPEAARAFLEALQAIVAAKQRLADAQLESHAQAEITSEIERLEQRIQFLRSRQVPGKQLEEETRDRQRALDEAIRRAQQLAERLAGVKKHEAQASARKPE